MKLLVLILFSTLSAYTQTISGKVLDDQTNEPLENVTIYLKKQNTGTTTNKEGVYNVPVQINLTLSDTIIFSSIGYTTKQYVVSELKTINFIVHLSKQTELLNEITVYNKNELKPSIPFKKLAPLKRAIYNFGSTRVGNKLYVIGGDASFYHDAEKEAQDNSLTYGEFLRTLKDNFTWENYSDLLQIYNIENDTWESKDLEFEPRAYHKLVNVNDKIYVLGGKTLSLSRKREYLGNNIEVFDINSNEIIVDHTNPHQAVNFAAFSFNDNIIVTGGSVRQKYNGEKVYTNSSHIFNISSGKWYELAPMKTPKEVNGILVKDIIYLIGGFNKTPLNTIESYNIKSGIWKHEPHLPFPMKRPSLAFYENIIYIFNEDKILTYNTENNVINTYKINLYLKNAQMHYYDNHLYLLGGNIEDEYTKTPSSNVYKINIHDFKTSAIISTNRM